MANFGSFRGCGPVFNFVRVGRVGAGKGGLLGLVVLWLGCSPWAGGAARAGWLVGLGWFTVSPLCGVLSLVCECLWWLVVVLV